jgi:hypothetical protein
MEKRLSRIEKQLGSEHEDYGSLLMVDVCTWPLADQDAFLAGTSQEREALILSHTGRRPAATGPCGPVRTIIDLPIPPMDPARAIAEAEATMRRSDR